MKVPRILETSLYASDLPAVARFYTEVVGLETISEVAGRHVFFRCGDGVLLVFDPEETERSREVPPHGARGPGHVAFAVEEAELDGWRRRLAAHGVEIEREVEWPRGGRSIYLRDPAGNSVELASPAIWEIGGGA